LLPFAAFAVLRLWGEIRRKRPAGICLMLAGLCALAAATSWRCREIREDARRRQISILTLAGRIQVESGTEAAVRKARDILKRAVALAVTPGECAAAHRLLAQVYERLGEQQAAAVERARARGFLTAEKLKLVMSRLRENPADTELHVALGRHYQYLGKYREAAAELKKAAQLDPLNPRIHFWLAEVLLSLPNPDEEAAAAELETALECDLSLDTLAPRALETLADLHLKAGRTAAAAASLEAALRYEPENRRIREKLSILNKHAGDATRTSTHAETAKRIGRR